jgi:hypothetical protein
MCRKHRVKIRLVAFEDAADLQLLQSVSRLLEQLVQQIKDEQRPSFV